MRLCFSLGNSSPQYLPAASFGPCMGQDRLSIAGSLGTANPGLTLPVVLNWADMGDGSAGSALPIPQSLQMMNDASIIDAYLELLQLNGLIDVREPYLVTEAALDCGAILLSSFIPSVTLHKLILRGRTGRQGTARILPAMA